MDKITVPFITGDGVGVEITPSMQAIVNAAVQKAYSGQRQIEWMEVWAGVQPLPRNPRQPFRHRPWCWR